MESLENGFKDLLGFVDKVHKIVPIDKLRLVFLDWHASSGIYSSYKTTFSL